MLLFFKFCYSFVFLSVVIYRGDMPSGDGNNLMSPKSESMIKASTATGVKDASRNYP